MAEKSNLVLIGMPGAGKSSMGVVAAKMLSMDFIDCDLLIQGRFGRTLARIIDEAGAEGFIEIENEVLREIECENTLIATGGSAVYSEEVVWFPKTTSDPQYHYDGILSAMKSAAAHMPRVDAIGVSSAGVYIDNKVMVASLFLKLSKEDFEKRAKTMYIDVAKEIGAPLEVANDGDVTALAGAMELGVGNVLGIAMGTSEAGGYVDKDMNITGWLNELAFAPVDANPESMADEWSGDWGCGVKYFSQDGVIKLAPAAGIHLDESLSPAEKLKVVQKEMAAGNPEAAKIYESIGVYFGYSLAWYCRFYTIDHVLIMGRVTSGEGGPILLKKAQEVLDKEFPELAARMQLHIPDENSRRVGQSVAAASLPNIQ